MTSEQNGHVRDATILDAMGQILLLQFRDGI